MAPPTLVVVSGRPGAGKTTLAHALARGIGCPAVCRDEIKEGMVAATPGYVGSPGDELALRTLAVFFDMLGVLLRGGVMVVAEAAFQHELWASGLAPLRSLAQVRVVQCVSAAAEQRALARDGADPLRRVHPPVAFPTFTPLAIDAPELRVDTSDGYAPALPDIIAFCR